MFNVKLFKYELTLVLFGFSQKQREKEKQKLWDKALHTNSLVYDFRKNIEEWGSVRGSREANEGWVDEQLTSVETGAQWHWGPLTDCEMYLRFVSLRIDKVGRYSYKHSCFVCWRSLQGHKLSGSFGLMMPKKLATESREYFQAERLSKPSGCMGIVCTWSPE